MGASMADLSQLERALINADAAGDKDAAVALAGEIKRLRGVSAPDQEAKTANAGTLANIGYGALKGAANIGRTLVSPLDALGITGMTRDDRKKSIEQFFAQNADPESLAFKGGELGSEIAGTAGAGGVLAKGASLIPQLARFAPALESGGLSLGGATATTATELAKNIATRVGAGATVGGASAGLINPSDAPKGALVGGLLPPAVATAGQVGKLAKAALVDPLVNQKQILGSVLSRAVGNTPVAASEIPKTAGVRFSLGQASGSPGILAIEDALKATNPSGALGMQDQANRTALAGVLRDIGKDDIALNAAISARKDAAKALYDRALDPSNQQPLTPWVKGQITQLIKRPSINEASKEAQRWAIERGEKPSNMGSLPGLHDVKTALDDMIAKATREGAGGRVEALQNTKAQLLNVMEKLSPDYEAARTTFASMSKPINQMEIGQALANKLIPATAGDVPATLNAASLARALLDPDQMAKTATGFSGAKMASILEPSQLSAVNGVNADASRLAEMYKLGQGMGSPTARRQAVGNYIGQHIENASPMGSQILGALGNVPLLNWATKGASALGGMASQKINQRMAQDLEWMLANDPQAAQRLIAQALNARQPSGVMSFTAPIAVPAAAVLTSATP